jgi:hypothetical protein
MADIDRQASDVRKGQGDVKLSRDEFARRLGERFYDPAFDSVRADIDRIIETAWTTYDEYHKSPRTRKAGPEFADPEFELPIEWLEARSRVLEAGHRQRDVTLPRRILLVAAAARHDETCPGGTPRCRRRCGTRRGRWSTRCG